ncbi:pantothenate kinase [Melanogaster broomeanus]|nr:pantothenate kinase [Melanogaster broomeanus]
MPVPPLPSPRVIHVNTRGAVILAEESPETRDSRGIYLPNYIEPISHIAVDAPLAKVVYFTRSTEQPPSPSIAATQGSSRAANSFSSPSAGSPSSSLTLSIISQVAPSTLSDSRRSNISGLIAFISELIGRSAVANGVSIEEMRRGVKIMATGGGAHKFGELFEKELLVEVRPEDEMECLIEGMKFMVMIPEEVYYFSDELISELSHPSAGKGSLSKYPDGGAAREGDGHATASYRTAGLCTTIAKSAKIRSNIRDRGAFRPSTMLAREYWRVSGTSLGGGTLWGLLSLLTSAQTFDEMLALSEEGDNAAVDMLVGDIYGADYSKLGLKSTTIASSFGKVFKNRGEGKEEIERGTFKAEDISRSLLYAVSNNIGQIAYMNAEKYGLDRIYFGGCFIRGHAATITTLSYAIRFWSKGTKRALFLRHEGFLGAIGAWIKNIDPEEIQAGP